MKFSLQDFGLVTSTICCILTIAIYLYVKKLRNTLGKCIISCLLSIVIWQNSRVLKYWIPLQSLFLDVGIFIFFFFAHNLWLSVISFHLWKVFKSVAGEEHRLQFLAYSTFVWVTTAILPGGYSLISFFGGDDSPFARLFGKKQGSLLAEIWLSVSFLALLVSSVFNVIMFTLTITHILKVRITIMKMTRKDDETTTCFNFDSETYLSCVRILFVMGITWFLYLISFVMSVFGFKNLLLDVLLYFNWFYGIFVFILFILKRSTIKLLMDSIRLKPKKQVVRARRTKKPA
ncbi:probable G-protein coupled receptor Mth-like 7 [Drosophila suzukii]|uniref:Probable G-protein coupled receptor Mth-like 7 n=1 Tax=Drosophila suzukii TaxID=28584 RepID=A0ABM4TSF1_DROSZ